MAEQLTAQTRKTVVDMLATLLNKIYIFPETAQAMDTHLHECLEQGAYDRIEDADEFARVLTANLYEISDDLHFTVFYNPPQPAPVSEPANGNGQPEDGLQDFITQMRGENYGFNRVERLNGNIGYIDLRAFVPSEFAGETAVAAMNLVAHTRALIFDLRRNGGGAPSMIQLITSYLFEGEPKHLNSFYHRPADSYEQFWTLPYVPGKRMPDVPVYVLTSSRTGSAAEEFTYNLKHMKRATIIGETTAGAAHPGDTYPIGEGFSVFIPNGRAVNPITKTNWEGAGIEPDIAVPQSEALAAAHLHALQRLSEQAANKAEKDALEWELAVARATYHPLPVDETNLRRFAGSYDNRTVLTEDGALYLEIRGYRGRLLPVGENLFAGDLGARIRFVMDANGTVTGMALSSQENIREIVTPKRV